MPYLGKVSGQANESTVELMYQLGMVQDSGTRLRLVLLKVLHGFTKNEMLTKYYMALQKTKSLHSIYWVHLYG
jgi:hypothetical protein